MSVNREHRLDEIWAGDKLERRQLAEQVEEYIKARFEQPAPGSGSFTFAIEGSFGLGKSYFLERLKQQLALSHPVAFVNAWMDDTADDPLTSIFLALQDALAEKVRQQDDEKKKQVVAKAKDIAKIIAKGAIRTAGSALITKEGYEAAGSAFEAGLDEAFGLKSENRIETALVSRRKLISDFKAKLSELLDAMESDCLFTRPLVIIVDELDRCRPTYAIKLLEEAKHFFDDTGTIFVYGMNRNALAATVKSIYGDDFPADHYLMRFVKRQISLPANGLEDLINDLWQDNAHLTVKLHFPSVHGEDYPAGAVPWIADLFAYNRILARDAEYVLELIFSFAAMWDKKAFIHLPYLACLAVHEYKNQRAADGDRNAVVSPLLYEGFLFPNDDPSDLMMRYGQVQSWNLSDLQMECQRGPSVGLLQLTMKEIVSEFEENDLLPQNDLTNLRSLLATYSERLKSVGKFLVTPETGTSLIEAEN